MGAIVTVTGLAQLEVDALKSQLELVASGTMFNNKQILNASSATNYEIQAGANKDESFTIAVIQGATCLPTLIRRGCYNPVECSHIWIKCLRIFRPHKSIEQQLLAQSSLYHNKQSQ